MTSPQSSVATGSSGVLGSRPPRTETFHGSDPDTVAPAAICEVTPTKCQARTRLYRHGTLELEGFPVAEISEYLTDDAVTIWLDLRDPDHDDLAVLSQEFGLHPVAVEDAVQDHQRPKLDRYQSHLFLNAYGARLDTDTGELATSELAAFVTRRALITVRKDDGLDIGAGARWTPAPTLPGPASAACCTGCLTTSWTVTSRPCRAWTMPSSRWKISCSATSSRTFWFSGAASNYARAWLCSAGSSSPCVRW